jgi:hypothetical protein
MTRRSAILALCTGLLLFGSPAHAATLVDTGPGNTDVNGALALFNTTSTDDNFQFLAGEFTVAAPFTISSMEAWVAISTPGLVLVRISSDGGDVPGDELFAGIFNSGDDSSPHWELFDVDGFNWSLPAGTYWVALEPFDGGLEGAMPDGAPNRLANYAFNAGGNGGWLNPTLFGDQRSMGFRINGEATALPGHFLCYKAKTTPRTAKLVPGVVDLADQFGSGTADAKKVASLCVPADKNGGGIADPDTHLKGYTIVRKPKPAAVLDLEVTNQFGTLRLDTIKPDRLLVPAAKDLDNPVVGPDNASHDVDHYQCYKVKVTPGTPKFEPTRVTVADQFTTAAKTVDVKQPTRLCNPVDKNGESIKNPDGHLLCYQATGASGQPKHTPRIGVHVGDQFGGEQLNTVKEEEVCVPSTKSGIVIGASE